jgi:hypothetical protein
MILSEELDIDIDTPQNNGEVKIYKITGMDAKNDMVVNGYEIAINQADICKILTNKI